MSGGSYPDTWDKWQVFFAKMADGLLPYLQLYAKRNQRGSGLGNAKGAHKRFAVPIHGISQTGGAASINIVSPSQQSVDRAKSIMKQEARENAALASIKTVPQRPSKQTKVKRAGSRTSKASKSKGKSKQKPIQRRKTNTSSIRDKLS